MNGVVELPILFMINVRMRRVEQIRPHPTRHKTGCKSTRKCYVGTRDWMLMDSQVYATDVDAYSALVKALAALWLDRDAKQKKLHSEMTELRYELNRMIERDLKND
jgi:hypothetical protein